MKRILLSAVLALAAVPAWAADVTMASGTFRGEAAIEGGNKKLAREQALESALRDALVRSAGAELDAATETEGGTLLNDRIFVHANGYVKSYNVVDDKESDGTWEISIDHVMVGTGDLSRDLAAVKAEIARQGHPRLYVLLREQSVEELGSTEATTNNEKTKSTGVRSQLSQGVVAQRITEEMSKLGWQFVDPEVASGKVRVENSMTSDMANINARDFAVTGADFVVVGSVVVRPESSSASMGHVYPVSTRIVAYIKSTDTGDTIASVTEQNLLSIKDGAIISYDDSAGKAMLKSADIIIQKLQKTALETWRKRRNGVGKVMVSVAVPDYDILQAFEEQLQKGVANVKGVDEVSFNDGKAELSVSMAGTSPKQLAGSLSNKSVKGMQVKVTKVTTNTVEVKLVR